MTLKGITIILIASTTIVLCYGQKALNFELPDGNNVMLVEGKNYGKKDLFYYLPTNFRISKNEKGLPEFSLMYYTEEKVEEAILHFIIKWGLTEEQQLLTENMLNEIQDKPALIMGAISLNNSEEFTISQNTQLGKILKRSLSSSSKPPLMSGAKMALSFKINAEDTKLLISLLENKNELQQTYFSFYYEDTTNITTHKTLLFNIPFIKFFNSKL